MMSLYNNQYVAFATESNNHNNNSNNNNNNNSLWFNIRCIVTIVIRVQRTIIIPTT